MARNEGDGQRQGQGGQGQTGGNPRIMSYEEWYILAKKNAEAKGHPVDDATMKRAYDDYVWHAKNPQGARSKLGQQGTGTAEQQQTAQAPAGTYADDSPDAGNANTGDPYIDELRSGKVAGEEDWRRYSNAQLKEWEQYYVGGGKFKNQYGDIVSKPPDRGPNTPSGVNGLGVAFGTGGGGGGGRGGGGGGQQTNTPTGGLSASPATQAPTTGTPDPTTTPTNPADVYGQTPTATPTPTPTPTPGGTTTNPGGGVTNRMGGAQAPGANPIPPPTATPATPSAWRQSGVGNTTPSTASLPTIPTPNTPKLNLGGPTMGGPKPTASSGWNGGGAWVASDERLKDPLEMHFPLRKRRFTDWRK